MKKNNEFIKKSNMIDVKINPGSTSILLIFEILCLVAFSVLSFVSANSDTKLSNRVVKRSEEYYQACNRAQGVISQIDDELLNAYYSSDDEKGYYSMVGNSRSFVIDVSNSQKLHVSLDINYPTNSSEDFYTITRWQVEKINN